MMIQRILKRPVFYVKYHQDRVNSLEPKYIFRVAKAIFKAQVYPLLKLLKYVECTFASTPYVNVNFTGFDNEVPKFIGKIVVDSLYIMKENGNRGIRFKTTLDRILNIREYKTHFLRKGNILSGYPYDIVLHDLALFEEFPEYMDVIINPHVGMQLQVLTHDKRSEIKMDFVHFDCNVRTVKDNQW